MDLKLSNKAKRKFRTLTQEVLFKLRELGEIAVVLVPMPFESKYDHIKRIRDYQSQQYYKTFWDLEHKGWIKARKEKSKVVYKLTDLGRAKSLRYYYLKKSRVRRNDGFSTLVIFDIPETKRKTRDFLRRFLADNGFIVLQKSVMIGSFELHRKEFSELLKELKIENYVSIIVGKIIYSI